MTAKELQDEAMDMIVGGSTYMSKLAGFLQTGYNKKPCFHVSFKTDIIAGSMPCPANTDGMNLMIRQAKRYGKITLTSSRGVKKDFTAADLNAML